MDSKSWPTNIGPSGRGLRIRLWKGGKCIYSETLPGDPNNKTHLRAAVKRRDELQSRINLGLPLFESEVTKNKLFAEAAQEWLNIIEVKRVTRMTYVGELNRYWLPRFGNWMCHEIKEKDVKIAIAELDIHWKAKKNCLTPLRGVLDYAEVSPNPALAVTVKRGQKKKIERYTPDERDLLLSRLKGDCKVYFAIAFGTGMRPSEILALTWDRWDGERFYVDRGIVRGRVEESTKTNQARYVYVPTWVRPLVNSLTSRFKGSWLFINQRKSYFTAPETFNKRWKEAHDHLDRNQRIPYRHPYTCRHTRAAELLSSGSSRYAEMAAQLGHGLDMFLNIYSEFIDEYASSDTSIFEGISVGDRQKTDKNQN